MKVTCKDCGKEYTTEPNEYPYPGKIYQHRGEAICEDCIVGMGVLPDHDEASHERHILESAWYYIKPV